MAISAINGIALSSISAINGTAKTSLSSIGGQTIGSITFPVNGILDDFNRANETPLMGGWSINPYWFGDPLHHVFTNECAPVTGGFSDAVWGTNFNADQEVYLTLTNISGLTSIGLYCRAINENSPTVTNNYWYSDFTIATGAVFIQVSDGTESTLATGTIAGGALLVGDSIGFSCVGTNITIWCKRAAGSWVSVISTTSSRHNVSGKIVFTSDSNGNYAIDNFGGGNS